MKSRGLTLLIPYKMRITAVIIMGMASALMSVAIPKVVGSISDEIGRGINKGIDYSAISALTATAGALVLISFVINLIQKRLMVIISKDMTVSLRSRLSDKLDRIPVAYYDNHPQGDTLSRMTSDVEQINNSMLTNFAAVVTAFVTVIGCVIMMFLTNWILALSVIAVTIFGFFINSIMIKKGGPLFAEQQNGLGLLNAGINEAFNGHIVIKAFGAEQEVQKAFEERNKAMYDSIWKAQFVSQIMPAAMTITGNLAYVLICVLGAFLMTAGIAGASLSTIIIFILYVKMFQSPLTLLAQSAGMMMPAFAASDRVFELLNEPEMEADVHEKSMDSTKGNVEFSHVSFGYLPGQKVINDLTVAVSGGQKVAIVGPTGAGKTTIVNLLMRFYEPSSGEISIDGISINDISRDNLHKLIGMVLQDTWIFEGSVRDNIVYSTENVSDERLREVIIKTGLDHFVDTLPDGVDTVLSEKIGVSAGQKQLITIARAMIANPSILILDEATSSVDTRMERIIQDSLDKLTEGKTSFVIAHRLSTIRNADMIFVMKDGNVVEMGKHDELLKRGGLYSELYYSQFEEGAALC